MSEAQQMTDAMCSNDLNERVNLLVKNMAEISAICIQFNVSWYNTFIIPDIFFLCGQVGLGIGTTEITSVITSVYNDYNQHQYWTIL